MNTVQRERDDLQTQMIKNNDKQKENILKSITDERKKKTVIKDRKDERIR